MKLRDATGSGTFSIIIICSVRTSNLLNIDIDVRICGHDNLETIQYNLRETYKLLFNIWQPYLEYNTNGTLALELLGALNDAS